MLLWFPSCAVHQWIQCRIESALTQLFSRVDVTIQEYRTNQLCSLVQLPLHQALLRLCQLTKAKVLPTNHQAMPVYLLRPDQR